MYPPVSGQRTFYIRDCFCNTGTSVAYADVNLSRSVIDNDLLVSVRVDNKKSGHLISKIRCSLIRFVGMKFKNGCGTSRRLFQEKICSSSNRVKIPTGDNDLTEALSGIEFVIKPRSDILVTTPTARGKLIECEYNIKIQVYYHDVCGLSTFGFYVPVDLYNGMIPINFQIGDPPKTPENWNPVTMSNSPLELKCNPKKVYELNRDSYAVSDVQPSDLH